MTIRVGRQQFISALSGAPVAWPLAARGDDMLVDGGYTTT
jgi:hypothetical protein